MKKALIFCIIAIGSSINADIIIRPAVENDLEALIQFDHDVTFEYFLPLYQSGYSHIALGQNAQFYLEQELEADKPWFLDCIKGSDDYLLVAYDEQSNALAGLVIAHLISPCTIELDLLLVDQKYRGQGIGKRLVQRVIDVFPEAISCQVYPLKFANEATLAFYEAIGFTNHGEPTIDKINSYGATYKEMYLYYVYTIERSSYGS